jgi:hypothetical protein
VIDQAIGAIGSDPVYEVLPQIWIPRPIQQSTTGVKWLDRLIGGQSPRDVNGILGPFAGSKTTLAVQIAVERARFLRTAHFFHDPNHPVLGRVVYASYEEDVETEIRLRSISCAARIDKSRLDNLKSLDELSRKGQLRDYEIAMYKNMKSPAEEMDGEYERLLKAREEVGHNLHLMDMKNDGRGQGWIPELAAQIQRAMARHGWEKIDTVIIDYTKLMVRRYLKSQRLEIDRNLRHYINDTPMTAKLEIAEPLDCTVWILHQLSGDANRRSPKATLSHADAGEARDIAENMVNCVVLGVKDSLTQISRVFYTKGRRSEKSGTDSLFRTEGGLARTVGADEDFILVKDQFVQKSLHNTIHGPAAPDEAPVSTWEYDGDEDEDEDEE